MATLEKSALFIWWLFFPGNIHILFYSFDKIFHRIVELGQTRVPAHNMTFLAGDGSPLPSLPPQSSRSGIIFKFELFLFTSESIKSKSFPSGGLRGNAGVFVLAVGALSRRCRAGALQQGCPRWGSERALAASHHTALSGRFVSLALPKKGFPSPFPSSSLQGCKHIPWGSSGAPLSSVGELWAPDRHGKGKERRTR